MANWQAFSDLWNQGSFVYQVPAPNADPAAEPTVCIQLNSAWLPYVLGALFQLTQPTAWDPTSAGFADVLTQAQALMSIFSEGGECVGMLQFRCDPESGTPQYSIDGGVTWIDLPDCFIGPAGPEGPEGPEGPPGPTVPTTPTNIQGVSTDQFACDIAAYLASTVIRASINQAVSGYEASQEFTQTVVSIASLLGFIDPVIDLILGAGYIAVQAVTAATIGDFTSALASDPFWSNVQCAIFNAIRADGYVDSSNYAAVATALAAVTGAASEVITALVNYWNGLTLTGVQQLQLTGSIYVGDCSACGGVSGTAWFCDFGNTNYAQMASNIGVGTGAFSVGGWWKVPVGTGHNNAFIGNANFATGGAAWAIFWAPGSPGQCWWTLSDAVTGNFSVPNVTLLGNTTHHIVLVRNGATAVMYVDGVNVASTTSAPTGDLEHSGSSTWFGRGYYNIGGGGVDITESNEILWGWAMYKGTAMSAAAAAAWHAAGPFAPPPAGHTNYWPMDEGAGSTIHDTDAGNDATISGTASWTTHP